MLKKIKDPNVMGIFLICVAITNLALVVSKALGFDTTIITIFVMILNQVIAWFSFFILTIFSMFMLLETSQDQKHWTYLVVFLSFWRISLETATKTMREVAMLLEIGRDVPKSFWHNAIGQHLHYPSLITFLFFFLLGISMMLHKKKNERKGKLLEIHPRKTRQ